MSLSIAVLLIANLIPLIGVGLWGWDAKQIVSAYWLENFVIGFFNVLKIRKAQGASEVYAAFFVFHYGVFTFVHAMFLFQMFNFASPTDLFSGWFLMLMLFISHTLSYWQNFLGKKEYLKITKQQQVLKPYGRVVVMHLTVIFGKLFASPLIIMVIAKTIVDLISHLREHKKSYFLQTA